MVDSPENINIEGSVAVVTGGANGIGKGIVKGTKWAGEKLGAESFLNYLGAHISPVRRKVLKSLKLHKRDVVRHELEQKNIEIVQLRASLKNHSPRNNWWWAAGGAVGGVVLSYGAYRAFNVD